MIASTDILRLLGHTAPASPKWYEGKTRAEIEEVIRQKLREMQNLPFDPETARIELPAHVLEALP